MFYFGKDNRRKIGQLRLPANIANAFAKQQKGKPQPNRPATKHEPPKNQQKKDTACRFCKSKDHLLYQCEKFAEADLKTRLACVKQHELCFRCLAGKHLARDCKVRFFCNVNKCGKRHHKLLHTDKMSNTFFQLLSHHGIASDVSDSEEEQ